MDVNYIRRVMNAGKRWVEKQVEFGTEITPTGTEQAAAEHFKQRRYQYLFLTSALDVVCQLEDQVEKTNLQ